MVDCGCNGLDGREVEEAESYLVLEGRQSGVLALSNCLRAGQYLESRLQGG